MKLLTQAQYDQLIENGRKQDPVRGTDDEIDFMPVVKLFNPAGIGTWLERGINNAHLASVATYWDCVGGFEQVLAGQGGSLPAFYAEVARLAKLPAATRRERLCSAPPAGPH